MEVNQENGHPTSDAEVYLPRSGSSYKDIVIEDLELFSFEREFAIEGFGKIIKVCVEFYENADEGSKIQIFTKEAEEVLTAWKGNGEKQTYYPRVDVARQHYVDGVQVGGENSQFDYFYFFGGLFLKVIRSSKDTPTKTIKRVTILCQE